jgi:hypothetical protein
MVIAEQITCLKTSTVRVKVVLCTIPQGSLHAHPKAPSTQCLNLTEETCWADEV